jgi:hypothetical protein
LQSARDELLLPEQGPVGTAILFSVFLHIPVLLFFGAGIGHKAMTQDITPVFEAMYTGSRVENEYYGGAQITSAETTITPEVKTLSVGTTAPATLPKLLKSQGMGPIIEKAGTLPPMPLPTASDKRVLLDTKGRTWFDWYSGEIQRRIAANFPKASLLEKGITGEVYFRLYLAPDGSVDNLDVLRSDHPALAKAAEVAVKHAQPFPGYRALGLTRFPPLNITCAVVKDEDGVSQASPSEDERNLSASWTWTSQ